ncbi:imidazole glycerol phosphate synthase subunit HisF [Pseudomonas sp. PDM13]|uniref:imidazole glycerol phosphate synthase subunit HisF n=1 Tax=Pseudomonas sp. PDM13 TaxID=2769255 RepID=UPI0021E042A9|nr:imidazole glycerol phosphate synthase cyclase subunit [Pseudomonas sp. PDM13]MCU9948571.1 imidazole glycerol phosphate synthase cyclase subunit [Pseudomonas sp. PDM13]
MKKKRLIPVLLLKNGQLVQSKRFSRHQVLGNPSAAVKRLSDWAADELIYLDISRDDHYDMGRDDLGSGNLRDIDAIVAEVARASFMPITLGGRIRSLDDIARRLATGADKVTLNTAALDNPGLIEAASREYGSQCIVVSVDVAREEGGYRVFAEGGKRPTERFVADWASELQARGAGEVMINSIERDGARQGYDLQLLDIVCRQVSIPVIALGGVGEWEHLAQALEQTGVDAVAAANVFHYTDQSVYLARQYLFDRGLNVRSPQLLSL